MFSGNEHSVGEHLVETRLSRLPKFLRVLIQTLKNDILILYEINLCTHLHNAKHLHISMP